MNKKLVAKIAEQLQQNSFCPTGPGGGVDPSCGKDENGKKDGLGNHVREDGGYSGQGLKAGTAMKYKGKIVVVTVTPSVGVQGVDIRHATGKRERVSVNALTPTLEKGNADPGQPKKDRNKMTPPSGTSSIQDMIVADYFKRNKN